GGQPSSATVGPLRGTVVRLSADTVTLSAGPSATPTNLAIADVTSARVACGGNAMVGALTGGAIGALVGYGVGSFCFSLFGGECSPDPGAQRDGAILGGMAGLVAGALVGNLVTRWVAATFDRSPSPETLLSEPPTAGIPAETLIRPDRRGAWGKTVGGLVVTGTGIGLLIYDPSLKDDGPPKVFIGVGAVLTAWGIHSLHATRPYPAPVPYRPAPGRQTPRPRVEGGHGNPGS
ncbi:MAG: complement resistance protein TraT, partial [Gemmatimonadetes bacterium]|nr:complement resistance protein TraT [Gemmatimonadota bacterium]